MVCRNCGNEMRDDARFCPHCGAVNGPDQGGLSQGAAPAWEGPEDGGQKKKTGLIVAVCAAAVAVVALLVFLLGGMFGSPKGAVEKAFAKSVAAYAAAEEKLGMPDVAQWQQDQTISQRMALELKGINSQLVGMDLSALNGLGLRLDTDYNGPARQLYAGLGAYWGKDDLLSFGITALDGELYLESSQLFGSACYGMNTETLGADLAEMTGDDSMKDLSFNLFDLVDLVTEKMDPEAMEEDFKAANKALWKAAEVKKAGAKTLDLNGTETKATAYQITFPQEALNQYVDALETTLSALNYYDLYEEVYSSMGMPQDQIDEILSALEGLDLYGYLADGLRDVIEELGDVELEVCLSDGYVAAVLYEDSIEGSEVTVTVCLGGGEEYVDDLSVEIEIDGNLIELKSTGDHGLKSGVYTDETTLRVRENNSTLARVTSELSIDPSVRHDNFQWKLGVDSSGLSVFVLETAGDLELDEDHMYLGLENMSLRAMGVEVCTLAFDYYVDCHPNERSVSSPTLITQMSEQELEQAAIDIQGKAMTWAFQMQQLFASRLPDELLEALMYGF